MKLIINLEILIQYKTKANIEANNYLSKIVDNKSMRKTKY